jgi:hypothetical protein
VLSLLLKEKIRDMGVIPPEILGMKEHPFRCLVNWLEDHEIKIEVSGKVSAV